MLNIFFRGGIIMWPLLIFAIIIIGLTIKKVIDLYVKKDLPPLQLENGINAILFWGGLSVSLGFFGHYLGLYYSMMAIERAHDISPMIVAGGYGVSLITVLFGLLIFMISGIIWLILRWRYKNLISKAE